MMLHAFALYDTKAQYFERPVFFPHAGQALRWGMEIAADPNGTIGRYPEDYIIYEIGTYDDSRGELVSGPPRSLGPISALLRASQNVTTGNNNGVG